LLSLFQFSLCRLVTYSAQSFCALLLVLLHCPSSMMTCQHFLDYCCLPDPRYNLDSLFVGAFALSFVSPGTTCHRADFTIPVGLRKGLRRQRGHRNHCNCNQICQLACHSSCYSLLFLVVVTFALSFVLPGTTCHRADFTIPVGLRKGLRRQRGHCNHCVGNSILQKLVHFSCYSLLFLVVSAFALSFVLPGTTCHRVERA
jgi:hypothetical protein